MGAKQSRIVGYYGSWSTYRDGAGQCRVEDINANLCTHYIWCFLKIKNNEIAFNNSSDQDNLKHFVRHIRANNPNAYRMAAVGGWTFSKGSEFRRMVSSQRKRREFCESAIAFMKEYDLDGIDIDWEFPDAEDRDDFTEFIRVLHLYCRDEGKTLSVAVSGSTVLAYKIYDIENISFYADFINLMAYDIKGHWDDFTGHHAGWEKAGNIKAITGFWNNGGCPKDKLVIGIPAYGRTWTLQNSNHYRPCCASTGPGRAGEYTKEAGILAYFEILEKFNDEEWRTRFDADVKSPYAYLDDQWISYENVDSAERKARYIKENGFGGAMFWSLDMDDFDGNHGETFPLVKAVKNILHN